MAPGARDCIKRATNYEPSLEIKEDGQIWLIPSLPEEITGDRHDSRKLDVINQQRLAAAERFLCADQKEAKRFIWYNQTGGYVHIHDFVLKPGIYPIPDLKWKKEDRWYSLGGQRHCNKVAVISTHEQKFELLRDQEQYDMWRSILGIMDDMSAEPEPLIPELMKKFTITRKL